jgi:transposase
VRVPRVLPLDHFCPWREEAEELKERLTSLEAKMAALERHVFGRKAERLPSATAERKRPVQPRGSEAARRGTLRA